MKHILKRLGVCLLAVAVPAFGASDVQWHEIRSPEYGFAISTPCDAEEIEVQKNEAVLIQSCDKSGVSFTVISGETKKLTFGGKVSNFSYDYLLSNTTTNAQAAHFTDPVQLTIDGRRAFSTKQNRQGGVVYNQTVELNAEHILILLAGCGPARQSSACKDDDQLQAAANRFFKSIRVLD